MSRELEPSDRALADRLHRETVIWRSRLDHALSAFSRRPLRSLDGETLAALRIGAAQLLVLGVPAWAALDSTVGAVRGQGRRSYVNAVLRSLVGSGEPPTDDMAVRWSHPADLVDRWLDRFGRERTISLLEWNNSVPSLGACFEREPRIEGLQPGLYLNCYFSFARGGQSALEPATRSVYVQDEAAAIVGLGCARLAGRRALETCAAPGGKSVHLSRAAGLDILVSSDLSLARMRRWVENSQRLEFPRSHPMVCSGARPAVRAGSMDTVLIDAPCTGTGVYRRRNDARWNWGPELLRSCVERQRELLASAAAATAPGGRLIYSTCSLEPEENAGMVEWFEGEQPDFAREDFPAPARLVRSGLLDIFPPGDGIDGHFAAVWRRD
ncbi:hypothetical protein JW921_08935 [Candidatus Fermentibacterales bacterium]|nr:hypothetical protein [Candidatus Fermentibacterales bacterium]